MKSLKIICPAKINLDLKVLEKRPDGFHNIESTMQTINLYDTLTISIAESRFNEISLDGNSKDIPYDDANLVYKAAELYLKKTEIPPQRIFIHIDKKIPIAAGLAGGSTDAAGTIFGLNNLMNNILSFNDLHKLCAQLGSDINVCLEGGRLKTSGRGEIITKDKYKPLKISLIKPKNLGISAKEAYTKFSKNINDETKISTRNNYVNDLEWAIINDYPELLYIKNKYPNSIMTGSGSTYFLINEEFEQEENYWISNNLETVENGVEILKNY